MTGPYYAAPSKTHPGGWAVYGPTGDEGTARESLSMAGADSEKFIREMVARMNAGYRPNVLVFGGGIVGL